MPLIYCQRCGKSFKSETNLLQHKNQPVSNCLAHYEETLAIREALLKKRKRKRENEADSQEARARGAHLGAPSREPLSPIAQESGPPRSGPIQPQPNAPHEERSSAVPAGDSLIDTNMDGAGSACMQSPLLSQPLQPHVIERHPSGGAVISNQGKTFMDGFLQDEFADERLLNGSDYFPFASRQEWQVASFLACSGLSQQKINDFLRLELIRGTKLSFGTAADLFSRIEILPKSPAWKSKRFETEAPTKQKNATLFFRDPLECLQSLLHHPLMKDNIQYTPFKLYDQAKGMMRIYTEWLSGDRAWELQDSIPFPGATVLGTVLSSDKTTISQMTGNKTAYPLLISLANIDMDFRMKGSNKAFMLLALLPTPSFIHPNDRVSGMLANRFTHTCLNFVLEPLKIAARIGVMMSDALGRLRHCYTPLAAYIVDTPESTMIAGVGKGASSVTTALQANFGDSFKHPPRTALFTWQKLEAIRKEASPADLPAYQKASASAKYNGVDTLFWMDWPLAEPSIFLTPEPLHHWNKGFWDHDAKWCIHALGAAEINFRFSILQPRTGFRHFKEGISGLKQVTGREHRDVERYIVAVICGAVPNRRFLVAIRSLMDFRYLAQSTRMDEDCLKAVERALSEFHENKQAIVDSGARDNDKGKTKKWAVPKLEFLQSVAWNIRQNGVALQWSADGTERAHIDVIKNPSDNTNNQNYEAQIVRHLDRQEKCRMFDLGTAMRDAEITFRQGEQVTDERGSDRVSEDCDKEPTTADLLSRITPVATLSSGASRQLTDYFAKAEFLRLRLASLPACEQVQMQQKTFSTKETAFHLNDKPDIAHISVDEASILFGIPDLVEALSDYAQRSAKSSSGLIQAIGGRRGGQGALPFSHLAVWKSVRIQNRAYHFPHPILRSQTVNAAPPGKGLGGEKGQWEYGRFDPVVANFDPTHSWPHTGLRGHQVVDIRLIFCALPRAAEPLPLTAPFNQFLTYARRYDVVPQTNVAVSGSFRKGIYPDPDSTLFLLRRAKRANETVIGDIMPLQQVRALVDLIPNFGPKANPRLTVSNSFHFCSEYWLNKYFDKELYLALSAT